MQRDPLGPVLFSLGIHNILTTIQCKFQNIVVFAYLDDVILVGSSLNVLDAFVFWKQKFGNVGLQIQDKKCELYFPLPSAVPDLLSTDIPIPHTGTKILGILIGSHDFISNVCIDLANSGNVFCQKLPDLNELQGAMLLLRHCHATRLNHLARGVCPDSLQPAATIHNRLTKKCFTTLLGTRDLTASQWEQAALPIRLDGFGIILLQTVSRFAFLSIWDHFLQELPNRFTSLADHVRTVLSNCKEKRSIGYQLDQLLNDDRDLSQVVSNTKKLQHGLTDANN